MMAAKPYAEEVWLFPRPGCVLSGVRFIPEKKKKARSAIILLHGFSMTRNLLRPYAERLAARGYLCIAYDARGHGKSGGKLDIHAMVGDACAVADSLTKQGIKRVGMMGQSMGGLVSAVTAAKSKNISAVAVLSGIVDIPSHLATILKRVGNIPNVATVLYRMTKQRTGGISWRTLARVVSTSRGMIRSPSALECASKVKVPFLSIHGARDALVPFDDAKRLYQAVASENKELLVLEADHDLCVTHLKQATPVVVDFFDRWL